MLSYHEAIKNPLSSAYLICSEDEYLTHSLLQNLNQRSSPQPNDIATFQYDDSTTWGEIKNTCLSLPFFYQKNFIILKKPKLLQVKYKAFQKELENLLPELPNFSTLICLIDPPTNKRTLANSPLGKAFQKNGQIVYIDKVRYYNLDWWLQAELQKHHKKLQSEARDYLIFYLSLMPAISLGFLAQEIAKLALFTNNQFISKEDLMASFSAVPAISQFAITEYLGEKNSVKSFLCLKELRQNHVSELNIFIVIQSYLHKIWQIKIYQQERLSPTEIAQKLHLPPFIVKKELQKAQGFSLTSLYKLIDICAELDYKLKTGTAHYVDIDKLVLTICQTA